MKNLIRDYIVNFVKDYEKRDDISTTWRDPLVGFADASHEDILNIREATFEEHLMPSDVLENPTIIIAYFVPFTKDIVDSNVIGAFASEKWAVAYKETNEMFPKLNNYVIKKIEDMGYKAAVCKEAGDFSDKVLKSKWSHRHIARVAGIGTFGINNMLITTSGCCGRYYTIVTNLPVEPDEPLKEEYCLYKKNKSCGLCVKNCVGKALTLKGFDRFKCYEVCRKNFYEYKKINPKEANDICGKCVVNLPCSLKRP